MDVLLQKKLDSEISHSWAFGLPGKYEKVRRAGVPARHAVRTGWKACATTVAYEQLARPKL
jgi:hypothetical protein